MYVAGDINIPDNKFSFLVMINKKQVFNKLAFFSLF